jgi:hypothetical protein
LLEIAIAFIKPPLDQNANSIIRLKASFTEARRGAV